MLGDLVSLRLLALLKPPSVPPSFCSAPIGSPLSCPPVLRVSVVPVQLEIAQLSSLPSSESVSCRYNYRNDGSCVETLSLSLQTGVFAPAPSQTHDGKGKYIDFHPFCSFQFGGGPRVPSFPPPPVFLKNLPSRHETSQTR